MLHAVFSDSARGALLMAKGVRGCEDVYAFELALDVGDISEDVPGAARRAVLEELCHFSPDVPGIAQQIDWKMQQAAEGLRAVLARSAAGEPACVWYSGQPHELCGCCRLLAQLHGLGEKRGEVRAVRLPAYAERADGVLVFWNGWGELAPEEWSQFLPRQHAVPPTAFPAAFGCWQKLKQENAPLRAVVNGQLVSAPADFYDSFLRRVLAELPEQFEEPELIARVMGEYRLGVGDGLLAQRVEALREAGELAAVTRAARGDVLYRRTLRKM